MNALMLILPLFAFALDIDDPVVEEEAKLPEFKEMILVPKDDAKKDASFLKFRDQLMMTIAKKDAKSLLKAVSPRIKHSFGGDDGIESFKKEWKLDKGGSAEFWAQLEKVMSLGGGFMEKDFAAPGIFSYWPDEYDAFEYDAVVVDKAPLRKSPDEKSAVIRPLKREVVYMVDRAVEGKTWNEIATHDKKRGWVKSSEVHSPVGYRAIFSKKSGDWKMTHFIAGD